MTKNKRQVRYDDPYKGIQAFKYPQESFKATNNMEQMPYQTLPTR